MYCLAIFTVAFFAWTNPAECGQDTVSTPIADLRATPKEATAKRPFVRVRGIVSLVGDGLASPTNSPGLTSFCIEDTTAGIWVNVSTARRDQVWQGETEDLIGLQEGMEIELEGLLDPGAFAPVILPIRFRKLGEKPLPPARAASLERLMSGAEDVQRLRVSGVVQNIAEENEKRWLLKVETGLGHFLARLQKREAFLPSRLLDAEVEMTGLAAVSRNWRGEFICPRLVISHEADLVILKSPPSDPFASERVSLDALDGFSVTGRPRHRRCIEGIVTYREPGATLFLQEGNCAVRVESDNLEAIAIGDRVEAAGFIDSSRNVAGLSGAVIRRIAVGEPALPVLITLKEVEVDFDRIRRGRPSLLPNCDGLLVSMTGRVINIHRPLDGAHQLELDCGDSITTAFVSGPIAPLMLGTEVRATGVANVHYVPAGTTANFAKPMRIDLLLRGNGDIEVLSKPSWWTPQRMFAALLSVGAIAIAVLAWAVALRLTVATQTRLLVKGMQVRRDAAIEFQAALRERTRLAANLHDTVLQSMTGIAYQIEACESESLPLAQRGANHLATARRMVQRSQEDLRNAVWALRALPLKERTFAESVQKVATQITCGYNVELAVEITNAVPLLADFIAGNLLLIVQEAVHNAIKHARRHRLSSSTPCRVSRCSGAYAKFIRSRRGHCTSVGSRCMWIRD